MLRRFIGFCIMLKLIFGLIRDKEYPDIKVEISESHQKNNKEDTE